MTIPVNYWSAALHDYFAIQPYDVKGLANQGTQYYKRLLYDDLYSRFEWDMPKQWAKKWFYFWLFHCGSIAIIYSNEYGWVCSPWTMKEMDYQYMPRKIICANAYWAKEIHGIVGQNCEIIHFRDDYLGADDIVTHYSEMLAQCDGDINSNLMNSKSGVIFYANGKKNAEEAKLLFSKISQGEPAVFTEKQSDTLDEQPGFTPIFADLKNMFITPELLDSKNSIRNAFWAEIGIDNSGKVSAGSKIENWLEILNDSLGRAAALGAPQMKVKIRKVQTDNAPGLMGEESQVQSQQTRRGVG